MNNPKPKYHFPMHEYLHVLVDTRDHGTIYGMYVDEAQARAARDRLNASAPEAFKVEVWRSTDEHDGYRWLCILNGGR